MARRRGFGAVRKLPSGRWQASYVGPDTLRHKAPVTFETREDAEGWLTDRRREIKNEDWTPPTSKKPVTFGEHADRWLTNRNLKPRTRYHYRKLLDSKILPTFGDVAVKHMTADLIDDWYYRLGDTTPTSRSHAYGLVRTILGDAVQRRLIDFNPCHIRGAGNAKRVKKIEPATLPELEALTRAMPERYQLMILLAAWCGLRFGEITELRRKDIDLTHGVVKFKVRWAVVRVDGEVIVGTPKSDAGTRDVSIPPHLFPAVKAHLAQATSREVATGFSFRPQATRLSIWPRQRSTRCSIGLVRPLGGPISASTTYATPGSCSPHQRARPWRS